MEAKNKVLPPPELLRKVMLIADIKETLPFSKKGLFNKILGIFCQRYSLPQGASFYTAGGTFFRKLRFTWEHNGVITVQTYKPGNWELAVEIAYQRIGHPAGYPVLGDFINTEKSIVLDMEFIKAADKTIDMVRNIPTLGDNDLFRLWRKWDKPETANTFERAALLMELTKRGIADYKIRGWVGTGGAAIVKVPGPSSMSDRTLRKRWKDLEWEKEALGKSRHYWEDKISKGEELEAGGIRVADSPEGIRK